MINALPAVVLCLLLGDAVNRLPGLPLPGPVIGMLSLLTLRFVPVSAGPTTELPVLSHDAWPSPPPLIRAPSIAWVRLS
jgi:putative effector of murein hydrolase LrgA (UPF0299 family)